MSLNDTPRAMSGLRLQGRVRAHRGLPESVVRRTDERNDFALVSSVDPGVLAIDCNHGELGVQLAHANEAQISRFRLSLHVARFARPCNCSRRFVQSNANAMNLSLTMSVTAEN